MLSYKSRAVWQWTWKGVMIAAGVSLVSPSFAATDIPLTVTMSEAVTVTGTPRVAVDVGGQTRYATYTSGSTTSALTFTLSPTVGDLDLDGVAVSSPIDLNGGTIKDAAGNNATLTFTPPDTSGIKVNYPSLSMDFVADADGRFTLSGIVYNDFTSFLTAAGGSFSRTSTATYIDSTGVLQTAAANAARFDYDPQTLAPKGLLIEEARTNGITYSQSYDNAAWTKIATTISADVQTAPDGTMTADKLVATAATSTHYMDSPARSLTSGTSYTYSVYAKQADWSFIQISLPSTAYGANAWANFDLATGAVASVGGAATASIQTAGNGWYRLFVTSTSGATNTLKFATVAMPSDLAFRVPSFLGNGTSGVYIWGTQVEAGQFATSYIPTTSAALTRNVDSITVPTGSWFSATEGSLFLQADTYSSGATAQAQGIAIHAVGNNGYLFYKQGSSSNLYTFAGTVTSNLGAVSANNAFKTSLSYNATTARGALNNVLGNAFAPTSVVTPTRLDNGQAGQWNGHISKFRYYPLMPTPTQLQALTQ